jgi:STE24 endopeptidase
VTEDKATRYHRLRRRAEIAGLLWGAIAAGAVLLSGASALARDAAHRLDAPWAAVPLVAALLVLVYEAGALPLAWYGYRLERRYELSHQPAGGWLADQVKGTALGLVLAAGAALIVYASIGRFGALWWLAAGGAMALIVTVLATLAPVLLLPIFFRFRPLERPALAERLRALAGAAGARVMGVYEWTLGAKTSRANAALAGIGATRRIIISDTMLEQYSDDEIAVVLAHELGHHVHHDIWRAIAVESAVILAGFYAADAALRGLGPSAGLSGAADPAGLPLVALAAGAVSLGLAPLGLALSRLHERRADRFALELTGLAGPFVTAMRRLAAQNLAEERPSRIVRWLFHSHPPIEERIEAAERWGRETGNRK